MCHHSMQAGITTVDASIAALLEYVNTVCGHFFKICRQPACYEGTLKFLFKKLFTFKMQIFPSVIFPIKTKFFQVKA